MNTNYKSIALSYKFPELVCAEDGDFYICNEGETGKFPEVFLWTESAKQKTGMDKPSNEQLLQWYNAFSYREKRKYPPIEEQLDMQYWDSINGTTTWVDIITAIKETNPKGV
jgi:hypothetical protein